MTVLRETPLPTAAPVTPSADPREPAGRLVLVLGGLLLLAAIVLGIGQWQAPSMSPYDEVTHEGYAWDASRGHLPAKGDALPGTALEDWACQGIRGGGETAACAAGDALDPDGFPNDAQQYNFGHPPLYYLVTGLFAKALALVVPDVAGAPTPFLIAARVASILWIWSGLALLYVALRRWAVDWRIAASAAVVTLLLPTTLHTGTSVSNDAPFVLAGAAALLLLARIYREGRLGWVLPAVVTALAASTKILNGWVLLAVALVVFLDACGWRIGPRGPSRGRLLGIAAAMVGAVAAVFVAWTLFQSRRGVPDWVNPIAGKHNRPVDGLPLDEWAPTLLSGLNPGAGAYLDPEVLTDPMRLWQALAMAILVAGTWVALVLFSRRDDVEFAVSLAAAAGVLLYPLVVQLQVYASSGFQSYFDSITTRYGASVLPLVIACWALAMNRRRLVAAPVAAAGIGLVLVVSGELGLFPTTVH